MSRSISYTGEYLTRPQKTTKVPAVNSPRQTYQHQQNLAKILRELNTVAHATSKKGIQDVLVEIPKIRIIHKPTGANKQKEKRKYIKVWVATINVVLFSILHVILVVGKSRLVINSKNSRNKKSQSMVLTNRISWRKFDKLNKMEGLVTPERKSKHLIQTSLFRSETWLQKSTSGYSSSGEVA